VRDGPGDGKRVAVVVLRRIHEPATAGGDERVDDVDPHALTDTEQLRSSACEYMHLAPGPDSQEAPVGLAGEDDQALIPRAALVPTT
jgi:hypothetical protein